MTKSRFLPLLIIIAVVGVFYFLRAGNKPSPVSKNQVTKPTDISLDVDVEHLKIDGKNVVGLPKGKEKSAITKVKVANRATDNWKPALEKALMAQGGNSVKDIKIEKLDSFVWTESGIALYVESVKITLKNQQDSTVSFNAMVDSETGKILKNWNQPVVDDFEKREGFNIHIDPRYHNE